MTGDWQDRAEAWPLWVLFLVIVVLSAAADTLVWPILPRHGAMAFRVVGFAVPFAAGSTFSLWRRRRDRTATGGVPPDELPEVHRALRVGDAPRDPALDGAALTLIDHRRVQIRRWWRFGSLVSRRHRRHRRQRRGVGGTPTGSPPRPADARLHPARRRTALGVRCQSTRLDQPSAQPRPAPRADPQDPALRPESLFSRSGPVIRPRIYVVAWCRY
jgi:hypothetical protein